MVWYSVRQVGTIDCGSQWGQRVLGIQVSGRWETGLIESKCQRLRIRSDLLVIEKDTEYASGHK